MLLNGFNEKVNRERISKKDRKDKKWNCRAKISNKLKEKIYYMGSKGC